MNVKYRGELDPSSFRRDDITRSSFIKRVCYDARNHCMVLDLKGTYQHYCKVPSRVVSDFLSASPMGRHCNKQTKVSNNGGLNDCRKHKARGY